MSGTCVIEIGYKKGVADPAARSLMENARLLGPLRLRRAATSQLYRLSGDLSAAERARITRELLCDPIIQECRTDGEVPAEPAGKKAGRPRVVDIWYKAGVTDVVGESVLKGVRDLNIAGLSQARAGTRYRLWGLSGPEAAQRLTQALLANPLVQDSFIYAD